MGLHTEVAYSIVLMLKKTTSAIMEKRQGNNNVNLYLPY